MKFKKLLKESSISILKTKEWLDEMGVKNYTINDDGTVDVDGNVWLNSKNLTEIPVQFGVVSGWFNCNNNLLTSLKGSPRKVGGDFNCRNNRLTSLEGGPIRVNGSYNCSKNNLTTVDGIAEYIGGALQIYEITTLPPSEYKRILELSSGPHIKSTVTGRISSSVKRTNLLIKKIAEMQKELEYLESLQ